MPPRWHHLLAVVAMAVVLLSASANLEESQFQPKAVLEALSAAQASMRADLEEYKNSTRDARSGSSKETITSRTSRCEYV